MAVEHAVVVKTIITQHIYDGSPNAVEDSKMLMAHALVQGGAEPSTIEHQEPVFCDDLHDDVSFGPEVDPPHYHLQSTGDKWS